MPRLADFTARFPAIDLRLHTSVERVDLHLGTVDAAIRYRETSERDLYCTLLYEDRFIVVASPTLGLSRPGRSAAGDAVSRCQPARAS